ncbi:MAG: OmpA family protein [Flavobacteriales bacterium]|nr:OmpA family protein [Flavobacteriales bacterium]
MNSRTWIVLLAFLGWSIMSWYWYTCKVKGFCGGNAISEKQAGAEALPEQHIDYVPLSFKWQNADPLTSETWNGFMNGILTTGADDQKLVISGPYFKDESAPAGFDNLGLARASGIKDLFDGKLDPERIEIASYDLGDRDVQYTRFGDARFNWVTRNEKVQESMDGALIYFASDAKEKISNANIEVYLDKLAKYLIAEGGEVEIVGHTDNTGTWQSNKRLGMERAVAVKKILMSKGVDASKIGTLSEGEAQPIASNDNEAGKQKNRRTEIIIKK